MFSTRRVGMSLARRFNAGIRSAVVFRRVATIDAVPEFIASLRDASFWIDFFPALKDRAKFMPTLRVEEI